MSITITDGKVECYRIICNLSFMNIKDVGERIREAREKADLTQKQLADILGQSASSVTHWECGNKSIPLHKLLMVAKILKVSPAQLVDPETCSASIYTEHQELIQKTVEVLDSGTKYSSALKSNIDAFHTAVIAEINTEARLSALEEHLIRNKGGPEQGGQPAGGQIQERGEGNTPPGNKYE